MKLRFILNELRRDKHETGYIHNVIGKRQRNAPSVRPKDEEILIWGYEFCSSFYTMSFSAFLTLLLNNSFYSTYTRRVSHK
jgi:hypothetical protein